MTACRTTGGRRRRSGAAVARRGWRRASRGRAGPTDRHLRPAVPRAPADAPRTPAAPGPRIPRGSPPARPRRLSPAGPRRVAARPRRRTSAPKGCRARTAPEDLRRPQPLARTPTGASCPCRPGRGWPPAARFRPHPLRSSDRGPPAPLPARAARLVSSRHAHVWRLGFVCRVAPCRDRSARRASMWASLGRDQEGGKHGPDTSADGRSDVTRRFAFAYFMKDRPRRIREIAPYHIEYWREIQDRVHRRTVRGQVRRADRVRSGLVSTRPRRWSSRIPSRSTPSWLTGG